MATIKRGDRKPDLEIIIGDDDAEADFTDVTVGMVRVLGELDGVLVVDGTPSLVVPSQDGKELTVTYPWGVGETDVAGRMWLSVEVEWAVDNTQTFPEEGALLFGIERAPGDQ